MTESEISCCERPDLEQHRLTTTPEESRLSAPAFRLLAYLAWRHGSDNTCWPSISCMAADLHASNDTVRRHLRELEHLGYLHTTDRVGRSSVYSLTANPGGAA
ncbi:MAG: helix-turn-helix domain-containing protein, partial [Anaerolineae bacterium]